MSSSPPPPLEGDGSSSHSSSNPPHESVHSASTAASSLKPIHAFFASSNGGSIPAPPPPPTQAKRKRKPADGAATTTGQARLVASSNGTAWELQHHAEGSSSNNLAQVLAAGREKKKRGRPRKVVEGEEAEKQEMARRAQKEVDQAKGKKKKTSKADERLNGHGETSASLHTTTTTELPTSQPSPKPKKRARPSVMPDSSTLPPASPPAGPSSSAHRSSSPSDIVITGHRPAQLKASHPFFGRTLSSSSSSKGASQQDPIDVEAGKKPGPGVAAGKKLVFKADKGEVHSFFAKPPRAGDDTPQNEEPSNVQPESVVEGGSSDAKGKGKGLAALFGAGRGEETKGRVRDGWGRGIKTGHEWRAPLPGGVWPGHVNGPSHLPDSPYQGLPRRKRATLPPANGEDNLDDDFWLSCFRKNSSRSQPTDGQAASILRSEPHSIFPYVLAHAALSSPFASTSQNRLPWTERHRPVLASQVLGNELEATYLRDWLLAIQIRPDGSSRKIHRRVRRQPKALVDGWIVDDLGLYGDLPTSDDDDDGDDEMEEEFEPPDVPLGERPDLYPPLDGRLTNTILLSGPSGAGKSAAVHAVATELGWEVFEVYPGIGKRTSGNLMSWVGDVGKNHMVSHNKAGQEGKSRKRKAAEDAKQAAKAFFGAMNTSPAKRSRGASREIVSASQGSQGDPIQLGEEEEEDEDKGRDEEEVANGEGQVKQSLILLDEADILFGEENTFWPAVIALIAESRRPVVITCNDSARIPRYQLPLQTNLHFRPPPSYLAIPFLETLLAKEGLSPRFASSLYNRSISRPPQILDQPLPPNGNEPMDRFDLRRAVMQIQAERQLVSNPSSHACELPTDSADPDLGEMARKFEGVSWADAFVAPRAWAYIEVFEIDRHEASEDDEIGGSILLKPRMDERHPILAGYDKAEEIATETICLFGGGFDPVGDLQASRTQHVRSLLPLLDPLIPLSAHLLPHPSLFLDVLPVVQNMVAADDLLQAAEDAMVAEGGNRVNRKTGRPKRIGTVLFGGGGGGGGYERYLDLPEEGIEAARRSELVWR